MTRPPMPPPPPTLDDDIVAMLDAAVPPEPLDAAAHARIKRRLLNRIAEDCTPQHRTLQRDEGAWRELGSGLAMKVLHRDGDVMSYLMRMAPGAQLPPHRHPIDEECVVVEGTVRIGTLVVGAGGFHLGAKDVLHETIVSVDGALLYLRGPVPTEALAI